MDYEDYEAEYKRYIQENEEMEGIIKKLAQVRGVDEVTVYKELGELSSASVTAEKVEELKDKYYWDSMARIIKLVDVYNLRFSKILNIEEPLIVSNVLTAFDYLLQIMIMVCISKSPTRSEAKWIGGFSSFGNALNFAFQEDEVLKDITWDELSVLSDENFEAVKETLFLYCTPYIEDYFYVLAKLSASNNILDVLHVPVSRHVTALHENIESMLYEAMFQMEVDGNDYLNNTDTLRELEESILEVCLYEPWRKIESVEKEKIE